MTSSGLHGELFACAETSALLSDRAVLGRMLAFEAALARAEAAAGVIPAEAVAPIAAACDPAFYDVPAIGRETTAAGNPAIPLVKALTARVAASDPEAARWVHWGATSQDVIDSATVAGTAEVLALLRTRLEACCRALAGHARRHRRTVMPGRTLLQQAVPTSFGLKAAGWLDQLLAAHAGLASLVLPPPSFAGAAGTLASLGDDGARVAALMADPAAPAGATPPPPWHTGRRPLLAVASELGMTIAALGKIARDVTLLMQTEIGEVFEPAAGGRGGSSTMPHKRNPVLATAILAAATRAPGLVATMLSAAVQEHERAVGGWHAEWETLPQLLMLAGAATKQAVQLVEGLEIDADRMRANLEITHGLVLSERVAFALAAALGRDTAKTVVERACKRAVAEGRHLRDVLLADAETRHVLDEAAIAALFDPATYLGATDAFIDGALARFTAAFPG